MDAKRIVYKGDTAKWKITIHHADFDQARDEYRVELCYGMRGGKLVIRKKDMKVDEDGNVYMVFDSSEMVGRVKAYCYYDVPDTDMGSGIRTEVDIQWLCLVSETPDPKCACGGAWPEPVHDDGKEHVVYERVFRGDVNTLYLNLRTSNEEPILDSEGRQLRVRKEEKDIY